MGNKILAASAIIFVGIAFAFVAAIVFFSGGKSAFWVDKKLRVGGILLSLTSILSGTTGCGCGTTTCYDAVDPEPQVTCYDVAYVPYIFDLQTIENKTTLVLSGTKKGDEGNFFYEINQDEVTIAKGAIDIDSDGNFKINTGKKVADGEYRLTIYEGSLEDEERQYVSSTPFNVKEEQQ
ncbi:MAG: hypothetical protein K6F33_01210 [Bacteroidales bacterium]|nr:hypothetical protein [Bacteroidales bacterium]